MTERVSDEELDKLIAITKEATPGPWARGYYDHVQSARKCACAESYGPLIWEGLRDINGEEMLTHVHRRETPWDGLGIVSQDLQGEVTVAVETDEYGMMSYEDARFIVNARNHIEALLDEIKEWRAREAAGEWDDNNGRNTMRRFVGAWEEKNGQELW